MHEKFNHVKHERSKHLPRVLTSTKNSTFFWARFGTEVNKAVKNRIISSAHKTSRLSYLARQNVPIRRSNIGSKKPSVGRKKNFLSKNSEGLENRVKILKKWLSERLEPPGIAFDIPNFSRQAQGPVRTAAGKKLEQLFSYVDLKSIDWVS